MLPNDVFFDHTNHDLLQLRYVAAYITVLIPSSKIALDDDSDD